MSIVDPSGLLQRAPELEPIAAAVPTIGEALRSGKPHRVYRALWWARLLGRVPSIYRDTAKRLLGQRRLFLEPITSAPGLFTVNGIGTKLYGSDESAGDGLTIGVHYLVFVFIPAFPLSAYLYRSEGRNYNFYGKVPLGDITWVWKNALVWVAALGLLGAGAAAFHASRYADVWVLNALPVEVTATVGEAEIHVGAGGREHVEVPSGPVHVAIKLADGALVEEGDLEASAGKDLVAWNVGGLAPLFVERVVYRATPAENPPIEVLCGQRAVVRDPVQDLFKDPPQSVSMSKGSSSVTRIHVDQIGTDWKTCAGWAVSPDAPEEPFEVIADAAASPAFGATALVVSANLRAARVGPSAAADWLGLRIKDSKVVDDHRLYQDLMERAGRLEELLPIYAARHHAAPDDPDAAYLYARTLPSGEALTLSLAALARSPGNANLMRTRTYSLYQQRRFDEAAASIAEARAVDPEASPLYAGLWIEIHAALGRYDVAAEGCAPQEGADADLALDCLRLAALSGKEVSSPIPAGTELSGASYVQARAGAEVDPSQLGEQESPVLLDLLTALQTGPDAALAIFRDHPELHESALDTETALVLFGAAVATGDSASADRLRKAGYGETAWTGLLSFIEKGTIEAEYDDATHPLRAVAELMRARMPGLTPGDRDSLRAAAQRDDLLHGLVSMALARWSP